MNISTSECSSGCESGWTTYLDQLSNSTDPYSRAFGANCEGKEAYVVDDDQEDEDLSMVSDASSGPPHFFYENYPVQTQYYGNISAVSEDKKKIKKKSCKPKKQQNLCLDDTASSSIFHFSQARQRERERIYWCLFVFPFELCLICVFIIEFQDNVPSSAYHDTVENVPSKFEVN